MFRGYYIPDTTEKERGLTMNNIIADILKEYKDEIIAFASEVVKTRSLTCQEGEVASLIAGKMEELGYDEITIDDMGNVLGRIGSGDAKLMFDSHMDTVVVNDEQLWSVPPFSGEIKDGKLYGRGASDMKCGLVASVFGAFAAKKAGLLGDGAIYVSASSMEEDYDGDAVKYLLNKTGLRPDGVVICEPTSLRIATGHRGRALIEVKAEGRGCHASTPELGKNPVYMLRPVIDRVEKLAEELSRRTGEHGSVALTNIYCTTASNNSVPQDATIILDRRLALGESEEIIGKEMDKLVEGFEGVSWTFCDIPGVSWKNNPFVFHSFLPAWEISPEHELVRNASEAYREVLGKDAELFKMGCSTNGVTTAGVFNLPTIVCGPGDLAQAHSRDEFCSVDDLVNAVGIYARLCGLMTR